MTDLSILVRQLQAEMVGEPWHEVGATDEPAFENSWVNFGAPANNAAFFKDGLGFVHLRGVIKSGTVSTTAFTLPVGYRPPASQYFASDNGGAHARVIVAADGTVVAEPGNSSQKLDTVHFRTT